MDEEQAVLAVNAAYYRAFAAADAAALERLWALDGVTCIHPGWRPLIGREEVVRSYRAIFAGSAQIPIVCSGERVVVSGDAARVVCMERVGAAVLAATNCFARTRQGWLMTHHQASQVADAETARAPARDTPPRTLN